MGYKPFHGKTEAIKLKILMKSRLIRSLNRSVVGIEADRRKSPAVNSSLGNFDEFSVL